MTKHPKSGSSNRKTTKGKAAQHLDQELDEALEESFPASDPASPVQPPHTRDDKDKA